MNPGYPLTSGVAWTFLGQHYGIVVQLEDAGPDFSSYEFYLTPLDTPGVFMLDTTVFGNENWVPGDPGEYIVALPECSTELSAELLRIHYGNFGGVPVMNTYLEIMGTSPSSYGGFPGIARCDGTLVAAEVPPHQWCSFEFIGLILDPQWCVSVNDPASFSTLKSRF